METKWIFAAGMRRAGSTLHYHLIREVVEIAGGIGAGWVKWQDFESVFHKYNGDYPFVVIKTHVYIPKHVPLAKQLFDEEKAIAFLIYRDMRDIAASLIGKNRFVKEWIQVIDSIPAILQEYKDWASVDIEFLNISRYEDFATTGGVGLSEEVENIMRFLNIYPPIEIAKRHTLDAHRELITNTKYAQSKFSPETLFWENHLDNGEVGRYNELALAQIKEIEQIAGNWLKEKGYL